MQILHQARGTPGQILAILEPIYPKLARLSTDANVWNIARIEADRQGLEKTAKRIQTFL